MQNCMESVWINYDGECFCVTKSIIISHHNLMLITNLFVYFFVDFDLTPASIPTIGHPFCNLFSTNQPILSATYIYTESPYYLCTKPTHEKLYLHWNM